MQKYRFYGVFAACFGIGAVLLIWLLVSPDSPFRSASADLLNILGFIHIIPCILATILNRIGPCGSTGGDAIYWGLVFCQWFMAGFGLAFFIRGLRSHSDVR
jgi:hypothetical protein